MQLELLKDTSVLKTMDACNVTRSDFMKVYNGSTDNRLRARLEVVRRTLEYTGNPAFEMFDGPVLEIRA